MSAQTYWNGQPAECRKVRVIIGEPPRPTWWCAEMVGQEREAVEVKQGGDKFYIDNEDGSGWLKVTEGLGSPGYPHRSLKVSKIIK